MIQNLFALLYLLVLPLWVAMLLFPRASLTRRAVTSSWPFIVLGGITGVMTVIALLGLPAGELAISAGFLQTLLATGTGLLALWAHLLTLALFVGVWTFRDSVYYGVAPAPYLLLIHFTGPVGLAAYLLVRKRHEAKDRFRTLN